MRSETVTLFGVDPFDPDDLSFMLRRRLLAHGVEVEFTSAGDALRLVVTGPVEACRSATAAIPRWYSAWRSGFRRAA
jgi:hypothetical protein